MPAEQPHNLSATALEVVAPARSKWQREFLAFQRLLPILLQSHRGEFVAIHDEHVVDSGPDDIALIQRVHGRYGYVPIHVEMVTEQPPVGRIPHYREVRPAESS